MTVHISNGESHRPTMLWVLIRSPLFLCVLGSIGVSYGYVEKSAVPGSLEKVLFKNIRFRRATDKIGFTQAEKDNIVAKHNEFRRVPTDAANMELMEWDNDLETLAQNYAVQCKYTHNTNRQLNGAQTGENLYAASPSYTGDVASVISWNSEVSDYTYSSNTCASTKVCGHYTQVVWATSSKVGCGVKYCPTAQGLSWTDVYLVVCNYLVAGNVVGSKPYVQGTPCSSCPSAKPTCDNKLCSAGSSGGGTTAGSTGTTMGATTPASETTTSGTTTVTTSTTTFMLLTASLVFVKLI